MTRRQFLTIAVAPSASGAPLIVPVHHLLDSKARLMPEQIRHFWSNIWREAVRDLGRCGIRLDCSVEAGEVSRPPGREPVITGLHPGVINFVITDTIPLRWDQGRALNGVTTLYRGYHLCMVALAWAHGHQLPLLSVNTCLHELLHALLHDVFETPPPGLTGAARELRVDAYATSLWLLHDGAAIRKAAHAYVERLRSDPTEPFP